MYILCVKMIFLILIFLLGGLWETEAMSVTGVLGKEVKIKCSHSNAFNNGKYFCKGTCTGEDVLVRSKKNKDSEDKYSITDEGNTFYVTISRLTEDDSGTYWCGIDRIGRDTYNKVVLTVIEGNTQDPDDDLPQSNSSTSSSNKLVYIGAGLGVIVLALAMVLLIFFRHRNRDIHTSSGKNHDMAYATVSRQKQDGHHITTSSTANQDQETDGRTNSILNSSTVQHQDFGGDDSDNIYSNVSVSSVSQIQPDGLLYTTVSFNKHSDGSTDTPGTAALTYSAIEHKATDESAVYYNIRTQL